MELQKLSQTTRYRAEADGIRFEANVINENNTTRVEAGNIHDAETGTPLGNFNSNGDTVGYSLTASNVTDRMVLAQAVETFIAQLKNID